ncbi:MAG TPA: translation factor GTPase family protein [Actinomycetales bacterium]|nr:translation factor GTPase family protein [Actinomycetales bacterium]
MRPINIGILAHIDAGKTSLTERLLYDNRVLDSLGSVDDGTTQTDSNEIERRRGITIRTAVASFTVDDRQINLIDTPGHSEFITEVERALTVLDGAVLVISAVEGVQAQTRVLMKTLQALRLPTLIFINKIDRLGARGEDLLAEVRRRLSPRIIPMNQAIMLGTAEVSTTRQWTGSRMRLAEMLADHDHELLADLVADRMPTTGDLMSRLAAQTASGLAYPVYFGSARGGQGVADLASGIRSLLPPAPADAGGSTRGTVFAIERTGSGAKIAYARLFDGTVRVRQQIPCFRRDSDGTLTEYTGQISGLEVIGTGPTTQASAGDIAKITGLPSIRVGDTIGAADKAAEQEYFARPTLETLVRPSRPQDVTRLHTALLALAEQDPLISTRPAGDGQTSVLLYGEIQKEIIAETLARDFGVEAIFEPSRTVYLERPAGRGSAVLEMGRTPFVAGVGLRVEAAPPGTGIVYRRETEYGALRVAFHAAIEDTVYKTLTQGLRGWPVTDCIITLIHTQFDNACSTGGDFRHLTPLVVMRALSLAGTKVYEPCHVFEAEVPADLLNPVTTRLLTLEARIREMTTNASSWVISGDIPARSVHAITRQLPELTSGEGVWWSRTLGDRLVQGVAPTRTRTDGNPLNPREYMHHLAGKIRSR